MPSFEVMFRVEPAHVFGIRTDGTEVAPASQLPKLVFDHVTFEQTVTRSDGTSGERRSDEMLRASFEVGEVFFILEDNICIAKTEADNPDSAIEMSQQLLNRVLKLMMGMTTGVGALLTPRVMGVRINGKPLKKMVSPWQKFQIYDNQRFAQDLLAAAEVSQRLPSDVILDRALMYLGVGDAMEKLFDSNESDDHIAEVLPLRFLQYWKSLPMIVGDSSRDRDHQKRPQNLGLGREFFRHRVRPLNELRDKYDVAHSFNTRDSRTVTPDQVSECRGVATMAIQAYCRYLLQDPEVSSSRN